MRFFHPVGKRCNKAIEGMCVPNFVLSFFVELGGVIQVHKHTNSPTHIYEQIKEDTPRLCHVDFDNGCTERSKGDLLIVRCFHFMCIK